MSSTRRDGVALAALLLVGSLASARAFDDPPPAAIPALPKTAAVIEGFAPQGWIVEAKSEGDLDGDGRPDAAFVLHGTDPKLVLDNRDGLGPDAVDTNPRVLGVALAADDGYRLALQNATLIPRRDQPTVDDAFSADGGLAVSRGAVKVALSFFMSAGGWGVADATFTFRLDGGTLRLIGFDRSDTQRNSGETETVSVNYLSGRMSVAKGRIDDDPKDLKTLWRKAPAGPAPTVETIGDGLEFDPRRR